VALERQATEAIDQLGVGHPRDLHQFGIHARGGETGHRVELVDQHALCVHEEVHARKTLAADRQERVQRERPYALGRAGGDARGDSQLHRAGGVLGVEVIPLSREHDLARL
jgi:hypothetical protein